MSRGALVPAAQHGAYALAEVATFDELERRCKLLASTDLVPAALRGKPHDIMLIGLYGAEHGIPLVSAIQEVWVLDGKPNPSAQLRLGLIRQAGHEVRWVSMDAAQVVIRGRRAEDRGDPDGWTTVEYSTDDARAAGLLDRWVDKWEQQKDGKWRKAATWVIGDDLGERDLAAAPDWVHKEVAAGKVKQKDNWWKYRADMLCARAATRLSRRVFSDVLAGLGCDPYTADELGRDVGHDHDGDPADHDDPEDVDDAEVVADVGYVDRTTGEIRVPQDVAAPEGEAVTEPPLARSRPDDGPTPLASSAPPAPEPPTDPKQVLIVRIGTWNRTATDEQRAELEAWRVGAGIGAPDSGRLADYPLGTLQTIAAELDRRGWHTHGEPTR